MLKFSKENLFSINKLRAAAAPVFPAKTRDGIFVSNLRKKNPADASVNFYGASREVHICEKFSKQVRFSMRWR